MNIKIYWLLYVLLAPLIIHQIHYLAFHIDNTTLWFCRYLSGGLFLMVFIMVFKRPELIRLFRSRQNILKLLIYAVMLIVGSFACSTGIKLTNATTGTLISSMALPLTIVMVYVIWREEGELLKNRFAQMGFVIILIGISGFSLCSGQFTTSSNFGLGVIILIGGMINNCGGTLLLRSLLRSNDPVTVSGVGLSLECVLLFIPVWWYGEINAPWQLSTGIFGFLLFSGVFGAIVFLFSLYVLKISGVGVFKIITLAIPVMSAVFGIFFMDEKLNSKQIFFGLVLLAGSYLCLRINLR